MNLFNYYYRPSKKEYANLYKAPTDLFNFRLNTNNISDVQAFLNSPDITASITNSGGDPVKIIQQILTNPIISRILGLSKFIGGSVPSIDTSHKDYILFSIPITIPLQEFGIPASLVLTPQTQLPYNFNDVIKINFTASIAPNGPIPAIKLANGVGTWNQEKEELEVVFSVPIGSYVEFLGTLAGAASSQKIFSDIPFSSILNQFANVKDIWSVSLILLFKFRENKLDVSVRFGLSDSFKPIADQICNLIPTITISGITTSVSHPVYYRPNRELYNVHQSPHSKDYIPEENHLQNPELHTSFFSAIGNAFGQIVNPVASVTDQAIQGISQGTQTAVNQTVQGVQTATDVAAQSIVNTANQIDTALQETANTIANTLPPVGSQIFGTVVDIAKEIGNRLQPKAICEFLTSPKTIGPWTIDFGGGAAPNATINPASALPGANSTTPPTGAPPTGLPVTTTMIPPNTPTAETNLSPYVASPIATTTTAPPLTAPTLTMPNATFATTTQPIGPYGIFPSTQQTNIGHNVVYVPPRCNYPR